MTDFQTQFNSDIFAIIGDAFNESFISDKGDGTTFSATFTLLRAEGGDELPVGDNTLLRAEIRWQEADYSGAKPMDMFKRVATGDYWYISQEQAPEVDNFGEVIAQMTQLKQTKMGAI